MLLVDEVNTSIAILSSDVATTKSGSNTSNLSSRSRRY